MADWNKLNSTGNVEDRRGFGPTAVGGGLGVTGLIVYLVFSFFTGGKVDPNVVLTQLSNTQVSQQQQYSAKDFDAAHPYEQFASTIVGSSDDMWKKIFASQGKVYTPPKLVLFRGSTDSACGGAYSSEGPHYCPTDQTIYLDETFFEELKTKFGAQGGDVAEAYVIAHEAGHHAQNELGIMDKEARLVQNQQETTNQGSVQLELQADCFAGLWAYSVSQQGVLMPGEINQAIDAAQAVGDDRIQKETTGRLNPEQWTHGSSAERADWFNRGYSSGNLASCDTFK